MSAPPQKPPRPHAPSSNPAGMPHRAAPRTLPDDQAEALPDDRPDDRPGDEIPAAFAASAQPHDEDGVSEDMATLAVNPGLLDGVPQSAVMASQGSAHFAGMEDSAIM